jgi:hypothetical protein
MKEDKTNKPVKSEQASEPELPLLVELGFTFPAIFLILVDLMVVGISYVSGASWLDIFIRLVVTTVSVGAVLTLLSMNWSNGLLEGAVRAAVDQSETAEQAKPAGATKEA